MSAAHTVLGHSARSVTARTFQALQTRNYRYFFLGQTVSVTGSWLQTTAQAWLILELTHSPLVLGLLLTVEYLPSLLVQPLGGLAADRWSKRSLLLLTQSCFAVTALVLGVSVGLGRAGPAEVFAVVLLFGVINVVDGPARQAFVPEMVGSRQLANAVALNSLVFNGARVVGPALAGILIGTLGTALCFDLNALSYLAVIASLWLMRPAELHTPPRTAAGATVRTQIKEGLAYARRTPQVALVIVMMGLMSTFAYNLTLMITALAREGLHAQASGFGLLSASIGAGALAGAAGVAYASRASMRALLAGCAVFGLFLALAGLAPDLLSAMLLLALAGAGMIVYSATSNSVIQSFSPAPLRGRVMALYLWVFLGTTPLGSLLFGAVEQAWGSRASLLLAGASALLIALGGLVWWRRHGASAPGYSSSVGGREAVPTA